LKSSAKQDVSDLGTEIQTLEAGEALITSPQSPFAIPAKIHLYEEWLKGRVGEGKELERTEIDRDFF
jgi:hypothetical protein